MDHINKQREIKLNRLGFHYFLDTERFKRADAQMWFRNLQKLSADWLVLKNPKNRAVPEEFIRQAKKQNINIIINFDVCIKDFDGFSSLKTLLNVYGKWGIRYACLFREPNLRNAWGDKNWNTNDVVQKHADLFQQFARICIENNIHPIFSTLQPGGDYWDLAFLEKSLQILAESADPYILKKMVLSAYGWHWNHPLDWGAGGKAKWPKAKPFGTPANYQNHIGFRTYQWYLDISEKVLDRKLPIIIFETGKVSDKNIPDSSSAAQNLDEISTAIDLLHGKNVFNAQNPETLLAPIPNEVIACCFYLLSAEKEMSYFPYRWFSADGEMLEPAKVAIKNDSDLSNSSPVGENSQNFNQFKYQRYIYIEESIRQNMPNLLEQLDKYIKKFRPHIGFSMIEASNAAYLLIITDQKDSFFESHADMMPDGNITKVISPNEIQELMKA